MAKLSSSLLLPIGVAGVLLLWGYGLENGMVSSLLRAMVNGVLPDGTPLRTVYTGLPGIDHILTVLVAFFFNITRDQPAHRLFLSEAYTSLIAIYLVQSIEANRGSGGLKSKYLSYPAVWGFFAQCFGAGCVLPFYYMLHIDQPLPTNFRHTFVPPSYASTLIPSALLGGLLPAVLALTPLPRSDDTHQLILAAWQCYPIAVSLINRLLAATVSTKFRSSPRSEVSYLRTAYVFAFLLSFAGHAYSWSSFFLHSKELPSSFLELYIPSPSVAIDLKSAATLFLQYDWICIASSALLWGLFSVAPFVECGLVPLLFVFLAGFVVVGPGAMVSLAFLWREWRLRGFGREGAVGFWGFVVR